MSKYSEQAQQKLLPLLRPGELLEPHTDLMALRQVRAEVEQACRRPVVEADVYFGDALDLHKSFGC